MNRREFLYTGAAGLSAFLLPAGAARVARAAGNENVLVALYLRGGCDALQFVVPRDDPDYYALRPTIQVAPGTELDLDSFFGLNPGLAALHPFYQSGDLAFIHACGSPSASRSHFDSQDFMERASPDVKSITTGWLARYLEAAGGADPIQGISISSDKHKALIGPAPSVAFPSIAQFGVGGQYYIDERKSMLSIRYAAENSRPAVDESATNAFSVLDRVENVSTASSVTFPSSDLGRALRDAAALIKADLGVKVVTVEMQGWDHHTDAQFRFGQLAPDLGSSLAAFYADLGACAGTTLTLGMTEFGRRVEENGGFGADHGHGGMMFALGGGVAGGQVILKDDVWPGLKPEDRFIGQDLAVTTDFRDVFAEVLERHLGLSDPGPLFPGFSVDASNYPGLLA